MTVRVGDVGRALSPMSPSGAVEVNGMRIDARSDGRFIPAGAQVVVLRGDPIGYVVQEVTADRPLPKLSNLGQPIPRADFQRTHAEVAALDREEKRAKRNAALRSVRYGTIVVASLGVITGLLCVGAGWWFGWLEPLENSSLASSLALSAVIGGATGVALFATTGIIGLMLGFFAEGEVSFTPNLFASILGLVGAAVGFWSHFDTANPGAIATWTGGLAISSTTVAYLLKWLVIKMLILIVGE